MKSRFDTVVQLPPAFGKGGPSGAARNLADPGVFGRGGPSSTPRNLGDAAADGHRQPGKIRPRHAWWRDLHYWQAGATAHDDGRTSSFSSTCRSPDMPSRYSRTPSSLGWGSSSPTPAPSEHLKWARQVHVVQNRWLKDHQQLCKPSERNKSKHSGRQKLPALLGTMDASEWGANLRPDSDNIRGDMQKERINLQKRRALGLSRLHGTQQKWRESQKQIRHRNIQGSSEAARECKTFDKRSASSKEAAEMEASCLSTWAGVDSEQHPKTVAKAGRESPAMSRTASVSSHTSSEPESQPEPDVRAAGSDVHLDVVDEIARGIRRISVTEERRESLPQRGSRQLNSEPPAEIARTGGGIGRQMPVGGKPADGSDETGVEERKSSVQSLPGSSNRRESEEDASSRTLINAAMSFGALDPMPGAEPQEAEEAKFEAEHSEAVQQVVIHESDAMMIVHGKLRAWRAFFPLEVLNKLADTYDSWPCVSGCHTTTVEILEEVMQNLLGWSVTYAKAALKKQCITRDPSINPEERKPNSNSPQLAENKIRKDGEREEVESQAPSKISFRCLAEVLEVVSKAVEFVEMEYPEALWSYIDLHMATKRFKEFATAKGDMAVANLFLSLRSLGFQQMQLATLEDQRSLSDIVKIALAHKAKAQDTGSEQRGRRSINAEKTLSCQDFLRIASIFLRQSDQSSRLIEFEAEMKASAQFSFGLLEVEDIRCLFDVFTELRASGASDGILACFLSFLQRCGIKVADEEVVRIDEIVLKSTRDSEDAWSFSTFIGWLRFMHDQGIGDLKLVVKASSSHDLQGRTGFLAVILREHYNAHVFSHGMDQ